MGSNPWNDQIIWRQRCDREISEWGQRLGGKPYTEPAANGGSNNRCMFMPVSTGPTAYRIPKIGEEIVIDGARHRPELNGARGQIINNSADEHGRLTVKLYDLHGSEKKMKIQPGRLMNARSFSTPSLLDDIPEASHLSAAHPSILSAASGRPLGSAISLGARSSLSKPSTPGVPISGTGMLHLQARGGKRSKFFDTPFTRNVCGDPADKEYV
eukprot:TRINITY_DN15143_c0_g1_i1.p1 TRINITY_DN15143_c0_g1~~TRINITY_DN15143_c0_g1_i1.p1  ORF type:complete len:213 (-),score=19.40 TRINITY_DN15143_c0_g1_i1:426-1064(-)